MKIRFIVITHIAMVLSQSISQDIMSMNTSVYCSESVLRQFASRSPLFCAVACLSQGSVCAAFSHHEGECFLHSAFCYSLSSAEGSCYAGDTVTR